MTCHFCVNDKMYHRVKMRRGRCWNLYEKVRIGISPILTPDKNILIGQHGDTLWHHLPRNWPMGSSRWYRRVDLSETTIRPVVFFTSLNKSDMFPVLKKIKTAWRSWYSVKTIFVFVVRNANDWKEVIKLQGTEIHSISYLSET